MTKITEFARLMEIFSFCTLNNFKNTAIDKNSKNFLLKTSDVTHKNFGYDPRNSDLMAL